MLRALAVLLACQLVGEVITRGLKLPLPGPVLGLVLLVAILLVMVHWRRVDPATIDDTSLGRASNGLLATMGVLFVSRGFATTRRAALPSASPRTASARHAPFRSTPSPAHLPASRWG